MVILAVILGITALFVAIASFVDKVSANSDRDSNWRCKLIAFYVSIEDKTPSIAGNTVIACVAMCSFCLVWSTAVLGCLWLEYHIYTTIDMNAGFWAVLYKVEFWLEAPKLLLFFLFAILLGLLSPLAFLISAYGAARLLLVLFLGAASSPKYSPLAFTVAVLGIAVDLTKLVIDVAKAVAT